MPALLLAFQIYYVIQDNGLAVSGGDEEGADTAISEPLIGLVDEAGLIAEIPPDIPPDMFVAFPDEATARAALEAEEIDQVVFIPSDYIASGHITVYDQNFQILRSGENMGGCLWGC